MRKTTVLGQLVDAATHPVSTAAYVVGVVRGIGAGAIRAGADLIGAKSETEAAEPSEPARPVPTPRAEAAAQRLPDPPAESFATEPTAVTRRSAHGGGGDDAEIDDWLGDAELEMDPSGDPAAGGVVEALERGDGPGEDQVDHAAMRSVLSESERVRGSG